MRRMTMGWMVLAAMTTLVAESARAQPSEPVEPAYAGADPIGASGHPGPERMKLRDPVPPGYHVERKIRTGLAIGGVIVFGAMYALSVGSAAGTNGDAALYVPVVGPFVAAAHLKDCGGALGKLLCGSEAFLFAFDGLAQAGGIFMFAHGIGSTKSELVRNDVAGIRVLPTLSPSHAGLSVLASF